MKIFKFLIILIIYLIILFSTYYLHITLFKINVVFYSAIIDGFFAALILMILFILVKWFQCFSLFEKLQIVILCICLGYIFAISVPTVIDRSLSFYILEKIQQRGGGIRLDNFEYIFTREYVKEHRLVDVRLTEQQESGTIIIQKGCVKLTNRGRKLATFSRFFRKNLLPKQRLLMGEYTDDLTDPFRGIEKKTDYECR